MTEPVPDPLFEQLKTAVIEGNGDLINALTPVLLAQGRSAREILDGALLPAMEIVGARMKSGECFIPEVLLSARTMQVALDTLKPHLAEGDSGTTGRVVIGTVEGDLHDIGKNLVAMMLQGAGFAVFNLGTGISPQRFVEAVKEHRPQLLGMSALLTTTVPHEGHDRGARGGRAPRQGQGDGRRRADRERSPMRSAPTATAPTPAAPSTMPRS